MRKDAEKLEMGFFGGKRVIALTKGSRAEQAGLREGDEIAHAWSAWGAGDSLDNMMQVVVKRSDTEVVINALAKELPESRNLDVGSS